MFTLLILFLSLATSELLVTLLLEQLSIGPRYFWIEAFFDASMVAFISLFVIRYLSHVRLIKPQHPMNSETIQIQAAMIVFGMEALLMLAIPLTGIELSFQQRVAIDSILFALLSTVTIHLFLLGPSGSSPHPHHRPDKTINPLYTYGIRHLCSYLFGITLFFLFLLNTYNQQQQSHIRELIDRESQQLLLAKTTMTNQLSRVTLDVLALSKQQHLKQQLSGQQHGFSELPLDYKQLAKVKFNYDQIRVINATGHEEIRINQSPAGPVISDIQKLQDKSSRYYFHQTANLNPGDVYISPMDLNVEYNKIEIPFKAIVRASTIVMSDDGSKQGILIINLNAQYLLQQLDQAEATMSGNVMLLNEQGFWLHGGDTDANWAFMFPEKRNLNFRNRFPLAWQAITSSDEGSIKTDQGYFIFQTVHAGHHNSLLNEEINDKNRHWPTWKLISIVPTDSFEEELSDISRLLIMFFVLAATVIAIGTMMYTRAQINHHITKKKIHHLAHHDALTGLCNRRLFMEMIDHELLHAKRSHDPMILMYLDLDRFKPINDRYGHESGDLVLKGVARRLKGLLRESDTLCRLGGDEFAAILPNPGTREQVENVAQRILDAFEEPFLVHGNQLSVGISIGIANYRPPLQSRDSLLNEADQAMYRSKKDGRNCYRFAED